jgi:hypothetical protein
MENRENDWQQRHQRPLRPRCDTQTSGKARDGIDYCLSYPRFKDYTGEFSISEKRCGERANKKDHVAQHEARRQQVPNCGGSSMLPEDGSLPEAILEILPTQAPKMTPRVIPRPYSWTLPNNLASSL